MNYYPFHIGDYLSATRHLTWDEDAAFRRLLDAYYVKEGPLPLELRAVFRLVLASTPEQREAVETVLREFFDETPEGWTNKRADREIEGMREKQQKQRDKANARWDKQRAERGNATADATAPNAGAAARKTDADAMPPTPTPTPTPTREVKRNPPTPRKRRDGFDASRIDLPEWMDRDLWQRWCKDRADRRKPITEEGARTQIRRLDEYRQAGQTPQQVLDHAIASGYQGLYPPAPSKAPPPREPAFEAMR